MDYAAIDKAHAEKVAAENAISNKQRTAPNGSGWMCSGSEMADLVCQNAFRKSKNNGAKMRQILQNELENGTFGVLYRNGGAFAKTGNECHPSIPGCSFYMAQWVEQFNAALRKHIALIRD